MVAASSLAITTSSMLTLKPATEDVDNDRRAYRHFGGDAITKKTITWPSNAQTADAQRRQRD